MGDSMPKKKPSKMTTDERYKLFASEYVVDFNGTQAAIRAGYAKNGAAVTASRHLRNPKIQQYVQEAIEKRQQKAEINAQWVLEKLVTHATADVRQILDPMGNVLPPDEWPDDVAQVIGGMDINMLTDGDGNAGHALVAKIKRTSQLKALELLGRHTSVQAFKDQVEHSATDTLLAAIMRGRERSGK